MKKPHITLTVRERRRLTKDLLKAVAEDGAIYGPTSPAAVRLLKLHGRSDGGFQGMSRIADSLVEEGLLTPLRDSKTGDVLIGRVRGISQEGLRELDRLEHSWRTYFERHWSKWLLVGLGAITASATAITAAAQFLID